MPPEVENTQEQEQQQEQQSEAEAAADFEAGFASARGIEPPAPKPEKKEEQQATDKSEPQSESKSEPQKDPWEGVPPVVRQTLESITGKLGSLDQLAHEVKSSTGRIAAIQRDLATASKAATQAVESAPTQTQISEAMKAPEKWEKIKNDFPEWAAAMEERLNFELAKLNKPQAPIDVAGIKRDVAAGLEPTVANLIREATAQAETRARQMALIDFKHDGWEDRVRTKEFAEWLGKQPKELQDLAGSEKAKDAIRLLDEYDKHAKAAEDQRRKQERLRSAVPAKGAGNATPPSITDEDAFLAGFNEVRGAA